MSKLDGISIETFRGDYEGLERMAHASWREEYGDASFPNFYRPAFLHFLFDRIPAAKRDHLFAAYKGDEIVAFLANLPQKFHFKGGKYGAIYSCLLVTGREYLRRVADSEGLKRYEKAAIVLLGSHRTPKPKPGVVLREYRPAERADFIRAYLKAIQEAGCIGTLDWTHRGYPTAPFWRARFFPYPRAVNLVSWTFNPAISLAGIPEVYEIQV